MPPSQDICYLLVFIDIFLRWEETFPTLNEKAVELTKALLKEITPRFRLPKASKMTNIFTLLYLGRPFVAKITQQTAKALDINYHLHSS